MQQLMGEWLAAAGVKPEFAVTGEDGKPVAGIETHTFRNGGVTLVALMTNPQLRVDALGPPEFKSNDRFAKEFKVNLTLPAARAVYDVRAGKSLGMLSKIQLTVLPYEPIILAVSPVSAQPLVLSAPDRVARGASMDVAVHFAQLSIAANHAIRMDVVNPAGKVIDHYSGNWIAPRGEAAKRIPIALNDVAGKWTIRAHDMISGQVKTAAVEVY